MIASALVVNESRLASLLEEKGLLPSMEGECVPYVEATGGKGGVSSAIFQRSEPGDGEPLILAVRKTSEGVTVAPVAGNPPDLNRRVLTLPALAITDPRNDLTLSIPSNIRWQLDILVPQMMSRLAVVGKAGGSAIDSERAAGTESDIYSVRVVIENRADSEPESLRSIEIIESATGERVDAAWWLERPDGPGVIIGTDGLLYERLLWQSPVNYVQKSRGVGPAVTIFRRREGTTKGGNSKSTVVRTVKVREYHMGVDMLAPKGTEVHAVANSTVAFAGRRGGYGNLIVLNHGQGYQTYYAHLSAIKRGIKAGATVSRGEVIGLVGSTGHSTAPHLHFETRKDNRYIDPFDETKQLEFWLLTAEDQERLAMQLLASHPTFAGAAKVAIRYRQSESSASDLPVK
jgi:murein DD-endopeptidase MepM/ murein hydrolase activator NlpD